MARAPDSPADLPEDIRARLAPVIAAGAAFDGWGEEAIRAAALAEGIAPDVALYAFASSGQRVEIGAIDAWIGTIDTAMKAALGGGVLETLPVRERIRRLVSFRLEAVAGMEEAVRRALAVMALPQNAPRAARIGWRSADAMWRLAGDRSADYNHYTKRATLGALYAATLAVWVDDQSAGKAETARFLERRIAGVMRFEKAKARLLNPAAPAFSVTRFLGRLRYPAA
jgi:ubiquinone biosynthesis protein COQ9